MTRAATTFPEAEPGFALRPLTGAVELALAEVLDGADTRSAKVTAVLTGLFERIGDDAMTVQHAARLASGTRDWLVQRAAARLRPGANWFTAACGACAARYDLQVDLGVLPLKSAGPGFPVIAVETSLGQRSFEAPNGVHEAALLRLGLSGEAARRQMTALCGLDEDCRDSAMRYSAADLAAIDGALEALSPEAVDTIESRCPSCDGATLASIDPLDFAFPRLDALLREIHRLAASYHWAEAEILALSTARRRRYLALIQDERLGRRTGRGRP